MGHLSQIRPDNQNIGCQNCQNSNSTEYPLPEHPALFILHPFEKELPEGIDRGLPGETIINVLIILVCFEPKSIGVRKKQQAKEQEYNNKTKEGMEEVHQHSGRNSFEPFVITNCAIAKIIVAPRATCLAASAREPAVIPATIFVFLQMPMTRSIISCTSI